MGGLERRLQDLEAVYTSSGDESPGGRDGESGLTREFVSGVLATIAHVRRAPIDRPPHGYEIEKLHTLKPFSLAQYAAALTIQQHPDEDKARELLAEEAGDDAVLWSLIDAVVDHLGYSDTREVGF